MAKEIPLTQGKVAVVDDEDYDELMKYKWHATTGGGGRKCYAETSWRKGKTKGNSRMHTMLSGCTMTDHIDGDGLNNMKSNLRGCNKSQNGMNRGADRDNTTGYKGVGYKKGVGKFRARIKIDGKEISLGLFDTAEKAAKAYDKAASKLFKGFAFLNFGRDDEKTTAD